MEDYLVLALIMFGLGIFSLLVEAFLPTGGIMVVVALLFFAVGVIIIGIRGSTVEVVISLVALAIGLPAAIAIGASAYRKLSLGAELGEAGASLTIANQAELDALKNRTGKTVSPMRPSGTVEFDGKRIDAMTEGVMLDAGVWVRCLEVKGGKVIVRQMDPPADMSDVSPDAPRTNDVPNIDLDVAPPTPSLPPASPPPPARKPPGDLDDLDLGLDK